MNVEGKRPLEDECPFPAQPSCSGEVGFHDETVPVEGQIADGGEVIEVGIPGAGFIELRLVPAKLIVLHLEFNLVHPQLVDKLSGVLGGNLPRQVPDGRQALFGFLSQSIVTAALAAFHEASPP